MGTVPQWISDNKILSGSICAGLFLGFSLYTYLSGKWNRSLDLRIIDSIENNPPISTEEIAGRIGKSVPKTKSRLLDLLERGKVSHSKNNAKNQSMWARADYYGKRTS